MAFDLDETLGVPIIDKGAMIGWQLRDGCAELLTQLESRFSLCLWSVSPRRYVDKALSFGLKRWFSTSYSWDEKPARWKDIRTLDVDFLVDDSPHHREAATEFGIADAYILVPAYGIPEDFADPRNWVRMILTELKMTDIQE